MPYNSVVRSNNGPAASILPEPNLTLGAAFEIKNGERMQMIKLYILKKLYKKSLTKVAGLDEGDLYVCAGRKGGSFQKLASDKELWGALSGMWKKGNTPNTQVVHLALQAKAEILEDIATLSEKTALSPADLVLPAERAPPVHALPLVLNANAKKPHSRVPADSRSLETM